MVRSSVEETLNALLDAEADEICRRKAAETEHFPPTVSLQYHFNPNGNLRPYVGAGVNYTLFFSAKTRGALADSKLELDPSFGLAAQAGLRARGGGVHPRFGTANSRPALGQAFRKRRDCGAGLRQARRWKFRRRIRAESERQREEHLAARGRCGRCLEALVGSRGIEIDSARICGISQAGWIAPVAAQRTELASFLVL